MNFIFQGSQKKHVRVAISQKALSRISWYAPHFEGFWIPFKMHLIICLETDCTSPRTLCTAKPRTRKLHKETALSSLSFCFAWMNSFWKLKIVKLDFNSYRIQLLENISLQVDSPFVDPLYHNQTPLVQTDLDPSLTQYIASLRIH